MIFCAWSMHFTLAPHILFSPSFSFPSLKLLLPIHLFNSGVFFPGPSLNSFYIIKMCTVTNMHNYIFTKFSLYILKILNKFIEVFCVELSFLLFVYTCDQYRIQNKGIQDVCNSYLYALRELLFLSSPVLYQSQLHFEQASLSTIKRVAFWSWLAKTYKSYTLLRLPSRHSPREHSVLPGQVIWMDSWSSQVMRPFPSLW